MSNKIQFTEAEVRAMRDRVYGHATTDKGWDACKDRWMTPENIQWLLTKDASPESSNPS